MNKKARGEGKSASAFVREGKGRGGEGSEEPRPGLTNWLERLTQIDLAVAIFGSCLLVKVSPLDLRLRASGDVFVSLLACVCVRSCSFACVCRVSVSS